MMTLSIHGERLLQWADQGSKRAETLLSPLSSRLARVTRYPSASKLLLLEDLGRRDASAPRVPIPLVTMLTHGCWHTGLPLEVFAD